MALRGRFPFGENTSIWFERWVSVLVDTVVPEKRHRFQREILAFLHHCKQHRASASLAVARNYLANLRESAQSTAEEALQWWFEAAAEHRSNLQNETRPHPERHSTWAARIGNAT